jgi:hypothetical protein
MTHTMISDSVAVSSEICENCLNARFVVESECSCNIEHSWCEACWRAA